MWGSPDEVFLMQSYVEPCCLEPPKERKPTEMYIQITTGTLSNIKMYIQTLKSKMKLSRRKWLTTQSAFCVSLFMVRRELYG